MVCGFDPADEDASAYAWNYLSVFLGDFVHGITHRTTQLEIVRRLICDTSFVLGEQAESASPLAPSFWPVHPPMDRLLQYKRLANEFEAVESVTIAAMDATANNPPDPYDVSGYPSLIFSPANAKATPITYDGPRELDDMVSFIKAHASVPIKDEL